MPVPQILQELQRRRVFRVAAVYAVVAWIIIQVADITFPRLGIPEWVVTLVIALTVLAFPIALVLAWAFQVTPEGVERTAPMEVASGVQDREPRRSGSGRAAGWLGAGILVGVITIGGYSGFRALTGEDDVAPDRSIAVLPFENLSPNPDDAFFASGIHEEVLSHLARVQDLRVISRASVMHYDESARNLEEISSTLGVGTILEGTVRRQRDSARISVRLIDAGRDRQLWSETYNHDLADVFEVQSAIARNITASLRAELTPETRERIEVRPTENLAAYDLYLRARELSGPPMGENETAAELFEQAIRLDPAFADAYAGLAGAYHYFIQDERASLEWADSGLALTRKSLDLNPDLPMAHRVLANHLNHLGRNAEAVAALRRALELQPNDAASLNNLGSRANAYGRYDEAVRYLLRAAELDPVSGFPAVNLGTAYGNLGMWEEADQWLTRGNALGHYAAAYERARLALFRGDITRGVRLAEEVAHDQPGDPWSRVVLAHVLARTEEPARAAENFARAGETGRLMPFDLLTWGAAESMGGDPERADSLVEQALADARHRMDAGDTTPLLPFTVGIATAIQGNVDEAIEWLDQAFDTGFRELLLFRQPAPATEALQSDPRYQRLTERVEADLAEMRRSLLEPGN